MKILFKSDKIARSYKCLKKQTIECRRTTQRRTKQLGHSVAGSLVEIHVPDVTCKQNQFDSKAGTTARAIETLMGQYFD